MADALHPQTLVAYAMNDGDLPVAFGGPLRLRVPRQLGYKSVKFINRLAVTDSLKAVRQRPRLCIARRRLLLVRGHQIAWPGTVVADHDDTPRH